MDQDGREAHHGTAVVRSEAGRVLGDELRAKVQITVMAANVRQALLESFKLAQELRDARSFFEFDGFDAAIGALEAQAGGAFDTTISDRNDITIALGFEFQFVDFEGANVATDRLRMAFKFRHTGPQTWEELLA